MTEFPSRRGTESARVRSRSLGAGLALSFGLLLATGCTRTYYHDYADRDVYGILKERLFDWRWRLPTRQVEADPRSRMADPADPNYEPIPHDEPAARDFQISNRFPIEYHGWKKRGMAPVEYLDWQRNIATESDGKVLLSRDSIMRLAVTNSRDYQSSYEDLYLSALNLTLARFQFMVQGFSNSSWFYQALGYGRTRSDQVQLSTVNGFDLELMTGAQLMVSLANNLVFQYTNKGGFQFASPNLLINFTQPLLRGAWARIVTQQLSLQERAVLYALRSFAHFRRNFYVGLVAGNGYLGLLNQLQSIRNLEQNLKSYQRNLQQYEAELQGGFKSVLERDQIAFQYQGAQVNLLQSEAQLQTQLDLFKIQLGLPPELEVRLDDTVLQQFQLNNPRLDELRTRNDALYLSLLQKEEMSRSELGAAAKQLQAAYGDLERTHTEATKELSNWQRRLETERKRGIAGPDAAEQKAYYERKARLARQIEAVLGETEQSLKDNRGMLATFLTQVDALPQAEAVKSIRDLVNKEFRARLSEVFVAQTQIRVFLIELKPVDLTVDQAIQIALANRLDLKNALAVVTDAWRNVEVDANALRGILNFSYSGNLATAPNHDTLFRFDSSASVQRFGLEFQAPINRRVERNQYRADQIQYQRARRAYMLLRDTIVQQVRLDMRNLMLNRKQFDIGREQLISSSRQVEEAEYALQRPSEGGSPVTLNLLTALNSLLTARNGLITDWVGYETNRLTLYSNFDLMDIDANGVWTNENDPETIALALRLAADSPALSLAIPARLPDLTGNEPRGKAFFSDVRPSDRIIPDEAAGIEGPLGAPDLRSQPGVPPGPERAVPAVPPATPSPFAPPARR
jgi:outer membrane protein TolC